MECQVVARRKFKKKSFHPLLLVLLIPSFLATLLALITALLIDLGLARPGTNITTPGPAGAVLGAGIGFLIYGWRLRRQQFRLQQALRNLDVKQLTENGKLGLFLYLRSFRKGRSTLLRRFVPYIYGDQSLLDATLGAEAFHFEEDISNAIASHGLLIAIGDRNDSFGAGKIIISDHQWKDHFHWLATHSSTIFMQPDLTQSVRWEVAQLVGNVSYLRKTVWVMPRSAGGTWTGIRDGLRQEFDVILPPHHADGGMFRLSPDCIPVRPWVFTATLTQVLEEANCNGQPFDIERVWELAFSNERAIRANDQALRNVRKRILR